MPDGKSSFRNALKRAFPAAGGDFLYSVAVFFLLLSIHFSKAFVRELLRHPCERLPKCAVAARPTAPYLIVAGLPARPRAHGQPRERGCFYFLCISIGIL